MTIYVSQCWYDIHDRRCQSVGMKGDVSLCWDDTHDNNVSQCWYDIHDRGCQSV